MEQRWLEELSAAVTVTEADGTIVWMNGKAAEAFADSGGQSLVGSNVFDCHPEPSLSMIRTLYESRRANHYVVCHGEKKSVVHQIPRLENGELRGFVEIVIPVPGELAQVIRD